jgi:glycosyltransferase involved in cell wall biosynthesis
MEGYFDRSSHASIPGRQIQAGLNHSKMSSPVSVCVATYNGEAFVAEQLRSILDSPIVSEVIVSDDGSSDRTVDVVCALDDPRVEVVMGPGTGLVQNAEFLLRRTRGDYIFLADQDDIWMPGKVESMIEPLIRGAMMVVSDCVVVNAELRELSPSYFALIGSRRGLVKNFLKNSYLGCCMAFRRELLAAALPFPKRVPAHDWWLGMVAEMVGTVQFIDMPLLKYRRHGTNQSSASGRSLASLSERMALRANLASGLARRWWQLRRRAA